VHRAQYDELYEKFVECVRKLRLGSVMTPSPEGYVPVVDCGSMISRDRFHSLAQLVKDAVDNGAQKEGGNEWKHVYHQEGAYFQPTVVGLDDPSREISRTERT
jgi:acyl-CoA reductase-like NAD-dependent aldehyde dehydrogenase